MKIAFDVHGVLDTYPDVFKSILYNISNFDTRYILSGPPKNQIVKELDTLGYKSAVHYDGIISVVDYLKENNVEMNQNVRGSWYCDESIWWRSKAEICKHHGISILYDDKLEYKKHMDSTQTLFFHVCKQNYLNI